MLRTYITSHVVQDDALLLGHTTGSRAGGDAQGTSLSDRVGADGGIGRVHVLWKHRIFVTLGHSDDKQEIKA